MSAVPSPTKRRDRSNDQCIVKCPGTPMLRNCSKNLQISNKALNMHYRGPTEQHFYVWELHCGCCLQAKKRQLYISLVGVNGTMNMHSGGVKVAIKMKNVLVPPCSILFHSWVHRDQYLPVILFFDSLFVNVFAAIRRRVTIYQGTWKISTGQNGVFFNPASLRTVLLFFCYFQPQSTTGKDEKW